LVRRIVEAGHEIASHGWDHRRVFTMDAAGFRDDLARARSAIENAAGQKVTGYRAPSFSIDARTPWAHPVLAEQGYAYSSSVAPVVHDHYGWRDSPRFAWKPLADSSLIELPVTTVDVAGRRMAAGGGGFFRLLPYAFSNWAVSRVNRGEGRPAIFYFHPWEIDPDQPRVAGASFKSRLRHYTNLSAMRSKLLKLLRAHEWGRTDAIAATERERLA
jgi:polysaccharide deacetylase family protein (PEP-CTERM system associated)